MRSNCIVFALGRWFKRGGYFIIRKSHYGWWPHVLWSPDLISFQEFAPASHDIDLLVPPLWFRGSIRITDAAQQGLSRRSALLQFARRIRHRTEHGAAK